MSRASLATPCPVSGISAFRRLSSVSTTSNFGQDDTVTENLDYTRAIDQNVLRNARPRRKSTFQPKRKEKEAGITIFEDVMEDEELVVDVDHAKARPLVGKTLLSRPAQRIKMDIQPLGEIGQARQRTAPAHVEEEAVQQRANETFGARGGLKKDPRRRTIFVPTDDTTMMTIHPGVHNANTDRLNDTFQLFSPPQPVQQAPMQPLMPSINAPARESPKDVRKSRMSLAGPPKRLPLQQIAASMGNLPSIEDVPGLNGGKENSPPQHVKVYEVKEKKVIKPVVAAAPIQKPSTVSASRLHLPTAASQARQASVARNAVPLSKTQARPTNGHASKGIERKDPVKRAADIKPRVALGVNTATQHSPKPAPTNSTRSETSHKRSTPPKARLGSTFRRPNKLAQYPALTEDVAQPGLYDERWLSHEEVAITELINGIFKRAEPAKPVWETSEPASLREQMFEIYHQVDTATLHKRLQASLLYGALARPQHMPSPPDPAHDLGLRKRFIGLWLHTYEDDALRAAAEVVIGRQVPRKAGSLPGGLSTSESVLDPSKSKRALVGFLETFLVTVEDVDSGTQHPSESEGILEIRRWRKMMLRSLMLIWLLDQSKARDAVSGCLFKQTAKHKSSVSVLYTLSSLVIPSIGDITRALRHFDYEVIHFQDPLDEVVYRVHNLAVELRDGIFLTRLVETLLFAQQTQCEKAALVSDDATVTIILPDAKVLESPLYAADGQQSHRVLSQHLKIPCLGRAQKMHNVQVAFSALEAYGCLDSVGDVTAGDIVDGHREKTLKLLWSLLTSHGLTSLVDWTELTADIRRQHPSWPICEPEGQDDRENLLHAWADAYCEKVGVEVRNLTSSFADGRAYAAILDAFAGSIPNTLDDAQMNTVEGRLRALGCSTAFAKQLASTASAIPSRTATLASLALLASKLLPLTREQHAATTIQRAWRTQRSSTVLRQRVQLARLARSCAAVVQTQQKLITAASVLQRAWRAVLSSRSLKRNTDVLLFQVMARGWLVRRKMRQTASQRFVVAQSLGSTVGW